jgi:XRE family aerobic/anaerobic benzoate catabolism transcriptional regulator
MPRSPRNPAGAKPSGARPRRPARSEHDALLARLGARIRAGRQARGLTLAEFADAVGLSRSFLTDLELGRANVSLQGLGKVADALGVSSAALIAPDADGTARGRAGLLRLVELVPERAADEARAALEKLIAAAPPPRRVALIGLRGAGKSSLGRAAAERAGLRFVELDQRVEEVAGMPLADVFTLHGEAWYRRLEREALEKLVADRRPLVVATGGGIVVAADTYELLRRHFVTIWLEATPEDHWNRVVEQGDGRPMQGQPAAMARLREILAERAPLNGLAHHTVDTSALGLVKSREKVEAIVRAAASH